MRISDWSSDVCSSDLGFLDGSGLGQRGAKASHHLFVKQSERDSPGSVVNDQTDAVRANVDDRRSGCHYLECLFFLKSLRSEEHTSELQSLMRISYAVFCLKKKNTIMRDIPQQHLTNQ